VPMWSKQVAYMRYVVPNWVIPPIHAYRFEKFDTIFISQCLAPWCWDSLQEDSYNVRKKYSHSRYVSRQISIITLLLSSMSALLPTNILFTLSEACCSMFPIQFLMSTQILDQGIIHM